LFFRDVFMEKHWKSVISRSVCDYFFEHQRKVSLPEDIPPVIATPHHYLITVYRCSMFFVAVSTTEGFSYFKGNHYLPLKLLLFSVAPIFVVEFLHRVVDTFEDYFSECTESIIKEHYVVVYEVSILKTNNK
jgi:AP-3 complex subunit mu